MSPQSLALIAGMGSLPELLAQEARRQGYRVVVLALEPVVDRELSHCADKLERVKVGKLGSLIEALKRHQVSQAVFAGKVPKRLLYEGKVSPDLRALKLLWGLRDYKDDTIMLAITQELQKEGIQVLPTTALCQDLLVPQGSLTEDGPSRAELKDVAFGYHIAKEMGRLDIGQTVVVKDRAVMAVEAIEGTDEAILRGGRLAQEGAVVVKVAKPQQDLRFDVPVAGLSTIKAMLKARCRLLALEAEACLLLQREEVVREAELGGISVLGYRP